MRIRTIKPEFWLHEGLCKCSEFTRLLAIAILNWADDEGYFMANPILIRGQVFPFEEDSKKIPRSLQELSSEGWIELGIDSQGRAVGKVVNFGKHQRVDKPKPSTIKENSSFQDASKNDLGSIQGGKEGNRKGIGKEKEGNISERESASARQNEIELAQKAETIVASYPRRERMRDALVIVLEDLKAGEPYEAILEGTKACSRVIKTLPSGAQNRYVPNAVSFFQSKRWADDPETLRRQGDQNSGATKAEQATLQKLMGGRSLNITDMSQTAKIEQPE
jgi:hypothetical protein